MANRFWLALITVAFASSTAFGQAANEQDLSPSHSRSRSYVPVPAPTSSMVAPGGSWAYHHASTAAEGYLDGQGRYLEGLGNGLRGLGEGLYWNSLATINQQQVAEEEYAFRKHIFADAKARRDQESAQRAASREKRKLQEMEESLAVEPLRQQIDGAGGKIAWPASLQTTEFTAATENIDRLASQWTVQNHRLDARQRADLAHNISEARKVVVANQKNLSAADRAEAFRLLTDLRKALFIASPTDGQLAGRVLASK